MKREEPFLCTDCQTTDPQAFNASYRARGRGHICCVCKSLRDKSFYEKNKERYKKRVKDYSSQNSAKVKEATKQYRMRNKESIQKRDKKYREKNKARLYKRTTFLRQTNVHLRLLHRLRCRIREALKRARNGQKIEKADHTEKLLGCSIEQFIKYLESKFTEGMNWETFLAGQKEIHIDHIQPCNTFDLSKEDEQRKCFHYSNLQPLWRTTQIINGKEYEGNLNKAIRETKEAKCQNLTD